jgi:hypothetical protein
MCGIEYFVMPEGPNWTVRMQNHDSTRYDTLEQAIEAAMEAARGAHKCGFSAEVFVHRAQGGWATFARHGEVLADYED